MALLTDMAGFDLSLREENGALVELRRLYKVTELAQDGPGMLVLALQTAGVPVSGDAPDGALGALAISKNLVVTQRFPVATDVDKVDIEILYEQSGGISTDLLRLDTGGAIAGTGITGISEFSASLRSVKTSFDRPFGETGRTLIKVRHTFPTDDSEIRRPGATITQGGTIQVLISSKKARVNGIGETNDPTLQIDRILGHVNDRPWSGGEARTWLCTVVNPTIHDRTTNPQKWKFEFEFEYRRETWDPVAEFVDPDTGKPPPDLIQTVLDDDGDPVIVDDTESRFDGTPDYKGFWEVQYYPDFNFNHRFPSSNEAGSGIRFI